MNAIAASVARAAAVRRTSTRTAVAVWAGALAAAAAARFALAWAHVTPDYFPDEYRYAALGRSLATFHAPEIRGEAAHFPALLQPLLTAPAWWAPTLESGYRIVQAIGVVAFTLAAVPVFLLARRLGLSRGLAVAAAALALLIPDALYAGFVLSEPIAYPLALGAVAAGVAALVRPTRRTQVAFLALAVLAAAARVQFVVLPACYVAAALAVALRERRLRAGLREQRLVLGILVAAALAVFVGGPSHALGFYSGVLSVRIHPIAALEPLGRNLLVLAYAGGWVLVPGALLGLGQALVRPRSRVELAFGALATATTLALVLEATLLGEPEYAQERYFFYVLPLLALAFCLHVSRGWPLRRLHALLAAGMLVAAGLVALAPYAQASTAGHSPFLIAVEWVELKLGNGAGSLAIALAAAALAAVAAAASYRPRLGTAVALGLALAVCASSYAAAWAFDGANTAAAADRDLPAERSWVDAAGVGRVTLLTTAGGSAVAEEQQLVWNRSLDRALGLPGGESPDDRPIDAVGLGSDGTIRFGTQPLRTALLVDGHGATVVLRGTSPLAAAKQFTLWRPARRVRLAVYWPGRSTDGRLDARGAIVLWPRRPGGGVRGWLELTLRAPARGRTVLTLHRLGFATRAVATPGHPARLRVPACSDSGRWSIGVATSPLRRLRGRFVAGTAGMPAFVADAGACRAP